MFFFVFVSFSY
uniref:Uncharacterized protein n=1 Tax=Anguilla anguilla TaxID=7936 RepID=A0A0E9PPC7_ANGAN